MSEAAGLRGRRHLALTPRQIVAELDNFVVGQRAAKRAVAIALRNRWRRQQLPAELAEEIVPKNILMIGPTGVGKTEIARRLAKLSQAPFLKVEASKFTEVGYVGRDVESMVRDLVEIAIAMVREEKRAQVGADRRASAPRTACCTCWCPVRPPGATRGVGAGAAEDDLAATREKFRERLRAGALDGRAVEIEVEESGFPSFEMFTPQGVEEVGINLKDMMPGLFGRRRKQQVDGRRGARRASPGRGREADRPQPGGARGAPARRAGRASSSSTSSTRSPAASAAAAVPTSRARACSATSCRSSRAPPCRPSTGR